MFTSASPQSHHFHVGPHGKSTLSHGQGVYVADLSKSSPLSATIPALTKTLGALDGWWFVGESPFLDDYNIYNAQ